MEDLTGKQFGQYQIVAPLGEGGMAAVYKAYQPAMERFVAIKVLPRHMASSEEFIARFRREARMLAQLQHPHILPVFDYGEANNYPYIVMPFVSSGTLAELLHKQRLPLIQVRQILTQIGDALSYAHGHGMIHRDIKPSNVLIDELGNCLLTDFGLARMAEVSTNLTASGAVMGTPAYMSPEQGAGSNIDQRSDIYSLGIVLYEMVTGRVPYTAETPVAVVFKHIQDPLPSIRKFNPNLPEAVELVLLKALAKNAADRYQTAQDFVRALQMSIQDTSENQTAVPEYSASTKTTKTIVPVEEVQVRNKWLLPSGILIGVAILAVGVFWASGGRNTQIPPTQPSADTQVLATSTLTAPTVTAIETQTTTNTSIPSTEIAALDGILAYLNDVQILYVDTFDNPPDSEWNIDAGTFEDGVMKIIGNENWFGASWNGTLGENQGVVVDFNYSIDSLSEVYVENGAWETDQYKRFGVYIGSNQVDTNAYMGKEDHGGAKFSGSLTFEPGVNYSFLMAILPNGELLEAVWNPSDTSETLFYREKFDESWAGLTWTLWIGVNQGTVQFDNFNQISFSGAK